MLIGRGFMRDVLAPGGWLAHTDLEGKKWELINTGTRNTYDIAINRHGVIGVDAISAGKSRLRGASPGWCRR
jgi:uncharacterized protein YPO0396